MSIKRFNQFLKEDVFNDDDVYNDEEGYDYDEVNPKDTTFDQRFAKFKQFLDMKAGKAGSEDFKDQPKMTAFSGDKKKMMELVVKYLNKYGITNPMVQKAILSTIQKESGFTAVKEASYKNTPASRIRMIFGSRNGIGQMSDAEIDSIKKDDSKFWELVYGGEWGKRNLGNTNPGDGAKFIGRGFNGITGRANYKTFTDLLRKSGTNVDLVSNPQILETNPEISAEVNALYFIKGLTHPNIARKYGNSDPNDFTNFDTALKAVVNANAGPGTNINRGFAKQSYDQAVAASRNINLDQISRTA